MGRFGLLLIAGCAFDTGPAGRPPNDSRPGSDSRHDGPVTRVDAPADAVPMTPDAPRCQPEFTAIPGINDSLYWFSGDDSSDERDFASAVLACADLGSHIAFPRSTAELSILENFFANNAERRMFVGILLENNAWTTVLGGPAPMLPWATNEPDAGEQHASMARRTAEFGFLYGTSERARPFLCQCKP